MLSFLSLRPPAMLKTIYKTRVATQNRPSEDSTVPPHYQDLADFSGFIEEFDFVSR